MSLHHKAQQPAQVSRRAQGPAGVSLREDQRGAMMVMGLFMALFMVGALYYILGVGDAVLFRRLMQDGGDAGAYAASVTAAKGMNLVALFNIIMAILVGILMLLRVIEWVLFILGLALMATVYLASIGEIIYEISEVVEQIADAYEDYVVEPGTQLLNKASGVIQTVWPYVAQGRAVYEMTSRDEYDPPVSGGFVVPLRGPELYDGSHGLPIEEDETDVLCQRGFSAVGNLATGSFDSLDSISGGLTSDAVGTIGQVIGNILGICSNDEIYPPYKVVDERDTGGEVWLGHEEFQYRSFVLGQDPHEDRWQRGERGVRMAQGAHEEGRNFSHDAHMIGQIGVAEAEYYFGAGEESSTWAIKHPKEDWMWSMEWKARLRRFRIAKNDTSTGGTTSACSTVSGVVGSVCQAASDFVNNLVSVH